VVSGGPGADELRIRTLLIKRGVGPDAAPTQAPAVLHQPTARQRDWLDDILDTPAPDQPSSNEPAAPPAEPSARDRRRIQPWWTGRHVDLTKPDADEDQDDEPSTPETDPDEEPESAEDTDEEAADDPDADTPSKRWRPQLHIPGRPRIRAHDRRPGSGSVVAAPAPRMSLLEAYACIPVRIRWLGVHATAAVVGYRIGWVQWSTRSSAWIHEHGWLNPSAGFYVGLTVGCELLRRRARHNVLPVRIALAVPVASLVVGALLYGTGWQHLNLEFHL
jgi:hypothetical protein